jgi:hypothetical protein
MLWRNLPITIHFKENFKVSLTRSDIMSPNASALVRTKCESKLKLAQQSSFIWKEFKYLFIINININEWNL